MSETRCPKCQSENIYQDGNLWMCPECANEWVPEAAVTAVAEVIDDGLIRDANGNVLADGDSIIVLKDLNIKGSSGVVKGGTKVRNIRVRDMGDGHDILGKIDGLGAINLKSEYVKKV